MGQFTMMGEESPWVQIPVMGSQRDLTDGRKKTVLNTEGPWTLVLLV